MRELFVDYNHIGHRCQFRTRLFRSEREALQVGDTVLVVGDAVEPREAGVVSLGRDGREAEQWSSTWANGRTAPSPPSTPARCTSGARRPGRSTRKSSAGASPSGWAWSGARTATDAGR